MGTRTQEIKMSKSSHKKLLQVRPDLHGLVERAGGGAAEYDAVSDAEAENGVARSGRVILDLPRVGETWWVETDTWVYIGIVAEVGRNFLMLGKSVRIHYDGRHGELWANGDVTSAEIEPHGGPEGIAIIYEDKLIEISPWPHAIPKPH